MPDKHIRRSYIRSGEQCVQIISKRAVLARFAGSLKLSPARSFKSEQSDSQKFVHVLPSSDELIRKVHPIRKNKPTLLRCRRMREQGLAAVALARAEGCSSARYHTAQFINLFLQSTGAP
jgi:hypothetical protein